MHHRFVLFCYFFLACGSVVLSFRTYAKAIIACGSMVLFFFM